MNALPLDVKQTCSSIVNVFTVQYFVLCCTIVVIFKLRLYSTCQATITSPIKRTGVAWRGGGNYIYSPDGIKLNNGGA